MSQTNLLKICFSISILGIFSLLLISSLVQPKLISRYSELRLDESVRTSGKVISFNEFQDFGVIRLDNGIIVTCNCQLKENSTIRITGKVTEYKNQLQIQAEEIENVF